MGLEIGTIALIGLAVSAAGTGFSVVQQQKAAKQLISKTFCSLFKE